MATLTVFFQLAVCAFFPVTVTTLHDSAADSSGREKRSIQPVPVLSMTTSVLNLTGFLRHGDHYGYSTALKHSTAPLSETSAKGIHVTWMLTPFVKFVELVSFTGLNPPRVVQKDDSITLKVDELALSAEINITFKVAFDPERSLKPAHYHVVTPVQLLYYDDYSADPHGEVLSKGTYFSGPLEEVAFRIELPGCSDALGIKSRKIKDYQITASTSYPEAQPGQARETEDAWCAKPNKGEEGNQFLQVDVLRKTRVTGVGTLRRQSKDHWISEYILQYSNNDDTWYDYQENGYTKKFSGPQTKSDNKMIIHHLRHPIEANNIRIQPLKWEQLICLRFELYGCVIEGSPANCISPLGLENGTITDMALTHSLPENSLSKPWFIRLNGVVKGFPFGWMAGSSSPSSDWLQIDFGSLRRVTRISTMGGYEVSYFVASFRVEYSRDGFTWAQYREDGQLKDLKGPQTEEEAKFAVLAKLAEPFVARYLRIIPQDGISPIKTMRAEIYGCFGEEVPPYIGIPEYSRRSFLLDPTTDRFFVCMYSSDEIESSCFSTEDGVEWSEVKSSIISVTALNPTLKELYGLDRRMNFHCSWDSGDTWHQITKRFIIDMQDETDLIHATSVPENMVSPLPTEELTADSSNGTRWGVSGTGIHIMTAGSDSWSLVGSWKCCGL